ncbi:phorbol-12-myristate-13-acetate-induced protein 1 [Sebastes fasciatus]
MRMARHDLTATIDHCAHELRQVGDGLNWRYKLLEILIKNYKTVTKIK